MKNKKLKISLILISSLLIGGCATTAVLAKNNLLPDFSSLIEDLETQDTLSNYASNGITLKRLSANDKDTYTFSYSVTYEKIMDKKYYDDVNVTSAFITDGSDASSYVKAEADTNNHQITLTCLQPFDKAIKVEVVSKYNTSCKASVQVDYEEKFIEIDSYVNNDNNFSSISTQLNHVYGSDYTNHCLKIKTSLHTISKSFKATYDKSSLKVTVNNYSLFLLNDESNKETVTNALANQLKENICNGIDKLSVDNLLNCGMTYEDIKDNYSETGYIKFKIDFKASIEGEENSSKDITTYWSYNFQSNYENDSDMDAINNDVTGISLIDDNNEGGSITKVVF